MIRKFFTCGVLGWCIEILFTATESIKNHDNRFKGTTSLWMFPIYGMACLISPLSVLLKGKPLITRGCIYTIGIFVTEFWTGKFLRKLKACPWSYENAPLNVDGVIRLDYAPYWFITGLLFEHVLSHNKSASKKGL